MSEYRILEGDCLDVLATLPERSVQTCITSPPYFGLRDYGTAAWDGGDPECDHAPRAQSRHERPANRLTGGKTTVDAGTIRKGDCHCGATRTDSQIGLEETPDCGRRGLFRLRADLTESQREFVARRLAGVEIPDA